MPHADTTAAGPTPRATSVMALVLAGAVFLAIGMRLPGFVHHDTTEVAMWANSGWAAGFWKHPPLLPWIVRAWSIVLPLGPLSLALLTAANMAVCASSVWGIAQMARERPCNDVAALAVLLLAAVPYASGMAVKLNHNSILISLWPLATLAFLRALDRPTAWRGALFGLACAAAMLAKYYSALLLVAFVAASFATPSRARPFYRSAAPYVAVAVFALAMTPHVLWMVEHHGQSLTYAFHEPGEVPDAGAKRGTMMALIFAVQAPLILAPMALAALLLWRFGRSETQVGTPAPHRFERELLVVTAIPFVLTIGMTVAFHLRGATAWAMPVFLALPAIVAARIGPLRPSTLSRAAWIAVPIVLALVAGTQVAVRQAVTRGADGLSDPRAAIALAAEEAWQKATATPLALVAGDQRLASAAVVFAPSHPQAWPSFNPIHAPWIEPAVAASNGFVALCRANDPGCIETATQLGVGHSVRCPLTRRVEQPGAVGPPFPVVLVVVLPAGRTADPSICPAPT